MHPVVAVVRSPIRITASNLFFFFRPGLPQWLVSVDVQKIKKNKAGRLRSTVATRLS
jgi:hypothetical protein